MKDIMNDLKLKIEASVDGAVEGVDDLIESGTTIAKKTYKNVTIVFQGLASIGITVALITAPVPTAVAISLMWIFGEIIEDSNKKIDLEQTNKKQSSKTQKVISYPFT